MPTASAARNLRSMAVALTLHMPVLLTGGTGAGKTLLVEHLAELTGRGDAATRLIKIQMGDDTDSKVLLGTYVCTDIPGQFRYQEGILTQAVRQGLWLLIEDIDQAPLDVISTLLPLVENNTLFVPGRAETIVARSGFQLFCTYRNTSGGSGVGSGTNWGIIAAHMTHVRVEEPSPQELHTIIATCFPTLEPVVDVMLQTFQRLHRLVSGRHRRRHRQQQQRRVLAGEVGEHNPSATAAIPIARTARKTVTPRDMMKWCTRINQHDPLTRETVFLEAVDCFCAMLPEQSGRTELIYALGECLDVTQVEVERFLTSHRPDITEDEGHLTIGRCSLNKSPTTTSQGVLVPTGHTYSYAFTKPALLLMERLAVCIKLNEPVLLVGETGTGKTTAVQKLARSLNKQLIVINMSQQSDVVDLLGA